MAMWPWRRSARPKPDKRSGRPRPGSAPRHSPVSVEQLEDRLAPATVTAPVGPGITGTANVSLVGTGTTNSSTVTVTAPASPNFAAHLTLPSALGNQTAGTLYVEYSNTGTAPLAAPLLTLTASQLNAAGVPVSQALMTLDPDIAAEGMATATLPAGFSHSVQILASGETPGVLQPGESEIVPVYWVGWQEPWNPAAPPFQFSLTVNQTTDTTAINWAALQSQLQPVGVSSAAWAVIFSGMTSRFGNTVGSYVQELDSDATYLGTLGENVVDVSKLWSFETSESLGYGFSLLPDLAAGLDVSLPAPGLPLVFSRTFSNSIVGRTTAGPLGYGWFSNWQSTLTVAPDGSVLITGDGGSTAVFTPKGGGVYAAPAGDFDTLTGPAGANPDYQLLGQNGVVTAYQPGGHMDYVRDADGNTIRAGYDGSGRLVGLYHSSGQSVQIAYNGAGLISSVTDSSGGQTTYSYDASGHYFTAVTGPDGRTVRYTYDTSTGTPTSGALLSVAYPDGTHDLFTYDSQGRLSTAAHDGGAEKNTWTYGAGGLVSITDADGNTRQFFFDDRALVKTVDPLGNATSYGLDGSLNLTAVTNALGQVTSNTYDSRGYLTSSTDPAGDTVAYSYTPGPREQMASVVDANGNTTSYSYDGQGNLLAIAYPDSTTQQFSYDPLGDQIGAVDPNGQATAVAYNAGGQVTAETFADGSSAAFTYDPAGDLLTATTTATDGTASVTSYTYATGSRELVNVSYPNGLSLTFTYDAGGRRTESVDQSGFRVNYQYDAVGRLARLSDGNGGLIVGYTYDAAGRLIEKDLGNGTYTTYQYDSAGNLAQLVNHGPRPMPGKDGPVNSSFAYGYDPLGRMTSLTTAAGEWTYTYDAAGRLVHAVLAPSSLGGAPGQDLRYLYDPAGNRTATVINGVTTNYVTNSRNEYVTVGSTTYSYDADSNLLSASGPGGTSTYTYNAANELVGMTTPDGTTWAYGYDALGHPVTVTTGGQTTDYLTDPVGLGYVVGAYTPGGSAVADYTYGLGLVSQVSASGAAYYDFDGSGSTIGLTGATGTYVDRYSYLPFGVVSSATAPLANLFTFQGQSGVFGLGGGTMSMGSRSYLPGLGRFLSPDALGIAAGSANVFQYAANDPLDLMQPTGLTVTTTSLWDSGAAHAAVEVSGQYFAQYAVPESRQADLFNAPLQALYWSRGQEHAPPRQTMSFEVPDDVGQAMAARALVQHAAATYQLWASTADALRDGAGSVPGNVYMPGYLNVFLHSAVLVTSGTTNSVIVLGTGTTGANGTTNDVVTWDEIDSIGTDGYGTLNFVAAGSLLAYRVDFQNDEADTAQQVIVTDQLDTSLDWSTFQFTEFGFGDTLIALPDGTQDYQTTLPMTWDGVTFEVDVELSFNPLTGVAVAAFESIDPATGLPPDAAVGFLPPEDGSGIGTGHIGFTAYPRASLATGTQIRNVAYVTVGNGATVRTDQVDDDDASQGTDAKKDDLVTIDNGPPAAGITALAPVMNVSTFTLSWWGQDVAGGSGIAYYDVYYSDSGGAFQPLLRHTTLTSTTFKGTFGHSYGFYSVATDNVGNVQATPAGPQAVTALRLANTTVVTSSANGGLLTYGQAVTFTATVSTTDPTAVISALAGETITFGDGSGVLGTGTLNAKGVATFTTVLGAGLHVVTATYAGDAADQGSTGVLRYAVSVNRALPAFTKVSASQTIYAGTPTVTLSGVLAAPTAVPVGQNVVITAGAVSVTAVVRADGSFSAVLSTGGLAASAAVYTIVYSFAGNANFNPVSNNKTSLTVVQHPFDATAKVVMRLSPPQWLAGSNSRSRYNYAQAVTITNMSGVAIAGPIALELVGLTGGTLVNAAGTSRTVNPKSVYYLISNTSLAAGATVTFTLFFYDPTSVLPRYTAHLIAGGTP
jgi:RHS repeat-associated protein